MKAKKKPGGRPGSISNPQDERVFRMIHHNEHTDEVAILFKIISRRDWDRLKGWHRSCPGSEVEHLMHGLFLLTIPAGGLAA